jgi:hypothetical protein
MMLSRWLGVIATLLSLSVTAPALSAEANTQKSSVNGVTVTVTPSVEGGSTWSFKVILDTHSQDLSDDLVKTAALIGSDGKRHEPLAWEGAAPGGHHREGALRFSALTPRPASLSFELRRLGEAAPRVFTWQLQP